MAEKIRRKPTSPWKHIYGVDRAYTRRFDAAAEREALHVCGPTCKRFRANPLPREVVEA